MSGDVTTAELAALEALGALSAADREQLRERLRAEPLSAEEAREIEETAALIGASLDPVEPPRELKARVVAAIEADERHVVRAGQGAWRDICAGVRLRRLASNRQRNSVTLLLEMAPGASYPGHSHRGAEESYVIRGSCRFGSSELSSGDFFHVAAGESHGDVVTVEGCLLLILADYADFAA